MNYISPWREPGHSHLSTVFFAVLCHIVFSLLSFTRARSSLGHDISRSDPVAACSEQGAAVAARVRRDLEEVI